MGRRRVLDAVTGLLLVCSAVRSCVVVELSDAGLAANVNSLWGSLPAYHGFNGTIYLDSWKFAYKCTEAGGFGEFFQPGEDFLQPWTPALQQQLSCNYVEYPFLGALGEKFYLDYGNARYDPGIVRKVWRLQPSMQLEVDVALAQLKSYAAPTIGFHVRGGDKPKEDAALGRAATRPVDLINTFLKNFAHVRGGSCVLIGDDPAALEKMMHLAKKHIGCEVHAPAGKRREGHHQEAFNEQPLQERCRATRELIKDIEVMAHADYFVGSLTSGMASVVETLRMTVYDKSQATTADVTAWDMGHRLRVHWGWASAGTNVPVSV